jgi:hypothetical protein
VSFAHNVPPSKFIYEKAKPCSPVKNKAKLLKRWAKIPKRWGKLLKRFSPLPQRFSPFTLFYRLQIINLFLYNLDIRRIGKDNALNLSFRGVKS